MADDDHVREASAEVNQTSDEPSDEEFSAPAGPRRSVSSSAPVMAAMMLAVGEIIEPEKTTVEIAVEHAKPVDEDPLDLDFGDLPPLS